MKRLIALLILFNLYGCTKDMKRYNNESNLNTQNSFNTIWSEVISDPLSTLPQESISFRKLFTFSKNIILANAKRTLTQRADILEPFEKLAHPNGVCLKGVWQINRENPYSGHFKNGTTALIIARASSAMSKTKRGEIRAFGMAGKLFLSKDKNQITQEPTANFFLIDDLGGTDAIHYTDVTLTNEPAVSTTSEVLKNILYAVKVSRAFSNADKNPTIRQLYEVSEIGEVDKRDSITPKWMAIRAKKGQTVDAKDFRNEFLLKNGKKIIFEISVASREIQGKKDWKRIGSIIFDESVVSKSCDHRLHFHHPKWRDDLKH